MKQASGNPPSARPGERKAAKPRPAASPLCVLLVQARLAWKDPQHNRDHLQELLERSGQPFDLAVFPETFTTGFLGDPDLPDEGMDGPTVAWLRAQAKRYDAALAGSAVIVEEGKRFNRFMLVEPNGQVHHYDKRHLFAFGGEDKRYVAGGARPIFSWLGWRISPQVCYDLRFPVWCRNLGDYDLQLFVSNWPGKRLEHWTALLKARAIENQAWVIGLNRVGRDGKGADYPGRSQVYDPAGQCVVDLEPEEMLHHVELDLDLVQDVRKRFPFLADADRFELLPDEDSAMQRSVG